MTEQEARAAKISEVWEEFNNLDMEHHDYSERVSMLRAVLLERCKYVDDGSGYYTSFMVLTDSAKHHLMTCFKTSNHEWTEKARHETIESALEMSAAYAFWAWELKQRNSESNGR